MALGQFGFDTFTRTSNASLTSHTSDSGDAWKRLSGYGTGVIPNVIAASDDLQHTEPSTGAAVWVYLDNPPNNENYLVYLDFDFNGHPSSHTHVIGILLRIDVTKVFNQRTYYIVRLVPNLGKIELTRLKNGQSVSLVDYAFSIHTTSRHTLRAMIRGTTTVTIEVYYDNTLLFTHSDSSLDRITSAGRCGIFLDNAANNTLKCDNFYISRRAENITPAAETLSASEALKLTKTSHLIETFNATDSVLKTAVKLFLTEVPRFIDFAAVFTGSSSKFITINELFMPVDRMHPQVKSFWFTEPFALSDSVKRFFLFNEIFNVVDFSELVSKGVNLSDVFKVTEKDLALWITLNPDDLVEVLGVSETILNIRAFKETFNLVDLIALMNARMPGQTEGFSPKDTVSVMKQGEAGTPDPDILFITRRQPLFWRVTNRRITN